MSTQHEKGYDPFGARRCVQQVLAVATLMCASAFPLGCANEGSNGGSDESDEVGAVRLSLEVVPDGVFCIRVTAVQGSKKLDVSFDVEPTAESIFRDWHGVPLGLVTFLGDALPVPCGDAMPETEPTYAADAVRENVVPGRLTPVHLEMRAWGRVDVHVDFDGTEECPQVITDAASEALGPWSTTTGATETLPACTVGSPLGLAIQRQPVTPGQFIDDVYSVFDGPFGEPPPSPPRAFTGDNNLYAGIWREGSDANAAWFTTNWNEFTAKWDEFGNAGLRMHDFETFVVADSVRAYAGIFREGDGVHAAWFTSDGEQFFEQWDTFGLGRLRMHDFETYVHEGARIYAGIFRQGTDAHAARFTPDWEVFTTDWDAFAEAGLRMHDFEVYFEDNVPIYAGVFREGSDANAALFTPDGDEFLSTWDALTEEGLRMHDFETYTIANQRLWAGAWRGGTGGHAAWIGVDWESLVSKWHELSAFPLRMHDVEVYPGSCPAECLNQLVMQAEPGDDPQKGLYNYGVTKTASHCAGPPGTCTAPGPGEMVFYRQPVVAAPDGRFVRFSAVFFPDQIFTLPFNDTNVTHNGWLYSAGSWHHAVDYGIAGDTSFDIVAAAPGTVIHVGWDVWSGGTVVVSHDAGGVTDAYRTIYMHVRNGPDADCTRAWTQTYEPNKTADWAPHYKRYLEDTGCAKDPGARALLEDQWGEGTDVIPGTLLGSSVARGATLARAGSTGPGGCGCIPPDPGNKSVGEGGLGPNTHLHIFSARRDPANDRWYLIDPYGMYAPSGCYPAGLEDPLPAACARYSVAWLGGVPSLP